MYIGDMRLPSCKMIEIWNTNIIDYRQFDISDNKYIYYRKIELKLLRRNEKNMITPYKKIRICGKRIIDYRQFNPSQFQYKCYMDIENELIASQDLLEETNDSMNLTEIIPYDNININEIVDYTMQIPYDETKLPTYDELYCKPPSYDDIFCELPPIYTKSIIKASTGFVKFFKLIFRIK